MKYQAKQKKISFPFMMRYDSTQSNMQATLMLQASDSVDAGAHIIHEDVYKVCSIDVDLSSLRKHLHRTVGAGGIIYYVLEFNIVMHIQSAQLKFGVERDGRPCSATANVTFI